MLEVERKMIPAGVGGGGIPGFIVCVDPRVWVVDSVEPDFRILARAEEVARLPRAL